MADRRVVIRVEELETVGDQVVGVLIGESDQRYVCMKKGKIALGDREHAIRYWFKADKVEEQIAEVKRRYGATWIAEDV